MNRWTYITNDDNSARYTLGKLGERVLFVIGINPSTARPDDLDRTVSRVESFAANNNYDGWVMLNVYPQRATNPNDIHGQVEESIHNENIQLISQLADELPSFHVWAAWGDLITTRPFLINCLRDVANAIGTNRNWLHLHSLTNNNNPRHPLYLRSDAVFSEFDIEGYIRE